MPEKGDKVDAVVAVTGTVKEVVFSPGIGGAVPVLKGAAKSARPAYSSRTKIRAGRPSDIAAKATAAP